MNQCKTIENRAYQLQILKEIKSRSDLGFQSYNENISMAKLVMEDVVKILENKGFYVSVKKFSNMSYSDDKNKYQDEYDLKINWDENSENYAKSIYQNTIESIKNNNIKDFNRIIDEIQNLNGFSFEYYDDSLIYNNFHYEDVVKMLESEGFRVQYLYRGFDEETPTEICISFDKRGIY